MHYMPHKRCIRLTSAIAKVLVIVLLASMVNSCTKPRKPTTALRITSSPTGAEVIIDGNPKGNTPVTVNDLTPGGHSVILLKDDYKDLRDIFALAEEGLTLLDLTLERETGILTINSKPPGAQVFITDINVEEAQPELLGETPVGRAKIETGSYSIQLTLNNHKGVGGEITIEANDVEFRDYSLKALEAYIQIFSTPTDSQIWLNDELYPETTPARLSLLPGEYTIGVYTPGFNMKESVVVIEPNGRHKFEAILDEGDMPLGMVLIPKGEFLMGDNKTSPDERPLRRIHLKGFYMDKYEVTNAQFKEIFPKHKFGKNQDKHPVSGVNWSQASEYAAAVGKRLATEEEWEKAARGAKGKEYPWGKKFNMKNANTSVGGSAATMKVGTFKKGVSEYGCYDMAGNVYEWTSTWYDPYPGNPEVTIEYGTVFRVLRGGSYLGDSFKARSAKRHYAKPDADREDFGFRCAKDLTR